MTISFFAFFISFFLFKFFTISENNSLISNLVVSKADITEPKFAINNNNKRIFVTAKEANFVDEGKILLKKNVKFTSDNFSIESDNVIFDRNQQTAFSSNKSIFKSKNTTIFSEGFNIFDSGNSIKFHGNATVTLK